MTSAIKCKGCGASISSKGSLTVCEYCGTTHIVSENNNASFAIKLGYLIDYNGVGEDIILPFGVKFIKSGFFRENKGIKTVVFPESLIEIEDDAFFGCENLGYISLPKSLMKIGKRAFKCTGLEEVHLSASLKKVDEEAFMGCESLKKVTIEKGFSYALTKVFKGCRLLEDVKISNEDFYPSLKASMMTKKNGDIRPTYFDAFQGTQYFRKMYNKAVLDKCCPFCGGKMKAKIFAAKVICTSCCCEMEYSNY